MDRRLEKIRKNLKYPEAIDIYENFLKQLDELVQKPVTVMNASGSLNLNGILAPYDEFNDQWTLLLPSDGGRLYFETTDVDEIEDDVIVLDLQ